MRRMYIFSMNLRKVFFIMFFDQDVFGQSD